jgi:Arc/MetJ-type ribon-helix-helix transcriptional regulator
MNMRGILNISMPASMIKEMRAEAKEEGFATVSEFIRFLVREWRTMKALKDLKESKKDFAEGRYKALKSLKDLR